MQGVDNYILWTGDPYDADINIQAIYEAENIQFRDLIGSNANSAVNIGNFGAGTHRGTCQRSTAMRTRASARLSTMRAGNSSPSCGRY